jgi:hypothetical protein
MKGFRDSLAFHVGAVVAGFVVGSYVFGNEMIFFLGNMVGGAFFHTIPIIPISNSIVGSYTTGIWILTIIGCIQGILIGTFLIESFSFGYIFGDLVLIGFLGPYLWNTAPSVVVGMVLAIISVIIGLYLRSLIHKRRNKYPRYYYG